MDIQNRASVSVSYTYGEEQKKDDYLTSFVSNGFEVVYEEKAKPEKKGYILMKLLISKSI